MVKPFYSLMRSFYIHGISLFSFVNVWLNHVDIYLKQHLNMIRNEKFSR